MPFTRCAYFQGLIPGPLATVHVNVPVLFPKLKIEPAWMRDSALLGPTRQRVETGGSMERDRVDEESHGSWESQPPSSQGDTFPSRSRHMGGEGPLCIFNKNSALQRRHRLCDLPSLLVTPRASPLLKPSLLLPGSEKEALAAGPGHCPGSGALKAVARWGEGSLAFLTQLDRKGSPVLNGSS